MPLKVSFAVIASLVGFSFCVATAQTLPQTYVATSNGMACDGSTDDATAFNALLSTVNTAGGGVIVLSGTCLINGDVVFPNDGATVPTQSSIRITGQGSGAGIDTVTTGATILKLNHSASVAKLDTRGTGLLEIDHISMITTTSSDCSPFIHTTNTTIRIHDDLFQGIGNRATACNTGIILGGTVNGAANGLSTSLFQGYGTVIERNTFNRMSAWVQFNVAANAVVFQNNIGTLNNGGTAAIDLSPTVEFHRGNLISGNLIEMYNYSYGIDCRSSCLGNLFMGNQTYDPSPSTLASYNMTGSTYNVVITSFDSSGTGSWMPVAGANATNQIITSGGTNK